MNFLRAAGMNNAWFVVMVLILLTSPAQAQTITTTHNGETIQWTISDNVKNIQPAVWNSRVGTQYSGCETFAAGAWSSSECYYEGEFPPVFASNQGSSVIDVSAMITPNTRWHKDSLVIDIGGFKEKTDCGYDCVLSCTFDVACPFIPPGGTYSLSKSAGFYPYASKNTGSVNPYSGYRITITYTRIRNAGYTPDGWGLHTFNINIIPTKKQQLEIAMCPECKGPPRRDYTDYIGKPYWQGIDVPLRDPRTPDPDEPTDELSDDDSDEYSDEDYSGTPENRQKSTGEGLGTCGRQGLPVYWVNTATLNLVVKDTDFTYKTLGPDISMTRAYNLDTARTGMFGRGWSFAYESSLLLSPGGAFVQYGDGSGALFLGDVSGATELSPVELQNPDGNYDRLYSYGTYWILKSKQKHWSYRYELVAGVYRLISITDRNGNSVAIAHNSDGTIQSITDAAGRATTFQYTGPVGLCTAMTAADGREAHYAYDGNSNLISTTDFISNTVNYLYDNDGYMTSMGLGTKVTQFAYSSSDNGLGWKHLSSVTDARGERMSYWIVSLDPFTIGVLNAEGGDYYYESSAGLTVAVWDLLGNSTTTEYLLGNPPYLLRATRTDSRGGKTTQLYESSNLKRGNIAEYTDARGTKKTYAYDAEGNMVSAVNALNQTITYGYDPRGNLTGITLPTQPGGVTTTITYDAKGQVTGLADFNGNTTSYVYDKFGNLTEIREPLGRTTTFEYEPVYGFFRTAMVDPLGNRKTFEYDANHRLTRIHYPDNTQKIFTYDGCARTGYTDENNHTTQMTRDPLLNIIRITDHLGSSSLRNYDGSGRLRSQSDPLNRTFNYTRDLAGRAVALTDPGLLSLFLGYDSTGNMTSFTDPRLKTSYFSYDAGNLLQSTTDPLLNSVSYSRDLLGRIELQTNARGENLGYTYGINGRIASKINDVNSTFTYGYDKLGNLTSVTDAGTTTFVYDALNQVTAIQYPDTKQVSFSYNHAGNISSVTYPGGLQVTYNHNNRNRLSSVSWGTDSITYAYDNAGNLLSEARSNTTLTDYSYNAANQLLTINHGTASGNFTLTYSRDAAGATMQETRVLPVAVTFPNTMTYAAYDDANRITSWGPDSYTYDADGNITDMPGSRSLTALYDKQNRVTKLGSAEFVYDGVGNRVSAVRGGQTTHYYYDQQGRLLFETDVSGNYIAYYIYGGSSLAATYQAGAGYFYHFDQNGNTVAITNAAGTVVNAYDYTPFGETANSLVAIHNPFTFVGAFGVMDEGNNIYFMKNRFYDAVTGRFMQKDPLGLAGGQANYYTYVGNAPVDRIDPLGLASMPRTEFPSSYGKGNGSSSCSIGKYAAIGNMAYGLFDIIKFGGLLGNPEISLPWTAYYLYKLYSAYGRVGGVIDHRDNYKSSSYDTGDAVQDILDPTHQGRSYLDILRAQEEISRKGRTEW